MDKFKTFWRSLSDEQKKEFAEIAKSKPGYIGSHLIYGRKVPQRETFDGLVKALNHFGSSITRNDLLLCFFPPYEGEAGQSKGKRTPTRRKGDVQLIEAIKGRRNKLDIQ